MAVTNFFIPVLMPGQTPDANTAGFTMVTETPKNPYIMALTLTAGIPASVPSTGQIFPRGEG